MNKTIQQLYQTAAKEEKLIIGLMSGTSLDGLDIALCSIHGHGEHTDLSLRNFKTVPYSDEMRSDLGKITSVENVSLQKVCLMHTALAEYHADLILHALREWKIEAENIDCIASHGQTIYHAPAEQHQPGSGLHATLQIGDGDHIARKTGILTISDFRQKHTAAGGEGAPMVALTDELLYADAQQSRLLLNIGGIANFTYLPSQDVEKEALTTDVGPGNTLIDQAMQQFFAKTFDEDGTTARQGLAHPGLLQTMLKDPFFSKPMPRTTGPELFNMKWVEEQQKLADVHDISPKDLIATLTRLSGQTITEAVKKACGNDKAEIYISGGGMYNLQLIEWVERLLNQPTHSFDEIAFNPDAKEAACFAVLANETLSGEGFIINPNQNAGRRINFGKISLPV